jgi:hypothetical protein
MAAVDIDRQAIERRDFPIARRGYEPAAVDSHLRALASEIEELQRELSDGGGETSLASTAGTQVQSILAATEAAAADIEQQARDDARKTREDADRDATSTRDQAVAQARGQVAFVANATAALLERVASMDAEVSALVESLRTGANRLAADLAAVETNMGELYDAASGQAVTRAVSAEPPARVQPAPPIPAPPAPRAAVQPPLSPPETAQAEAHVDPEAPPAAATPAPASPAAANGDLDGARLIALNMALNGESRADADRYLAENFQLADRQKLIDEVYAAIEA